MEPGKCFNALGKATPSLKGLFTLLKPSLLTLVDIHIDYCTTNDEDEKSGNHLAGLCRELEKMAGQNVVETIKLLLWVPSDYDYTGWGELDDVLLGSPEDWPALREVTLSFGIFATSKDDSKHDSDRDKVVRKLLTLTKLVESERVRFDFEVMMLPI